MIRRCLKTGAKSEKTANYCAGQSAGRLKIESRRPDRQSKRYWSAIEELFSTGSDNSKTWNKIDERLELIRKLQATESKLLSSNLKDDQVRLKVVPYEVFNQFVMEVSKQVAHSPYEIRMQQMHGLRVAYDLLPAVLREPRK